MDIYNGHALEYLRTLPADSVDCCATSPPYWGLRSYDGAQMTWWGGSAGCAHGMTEDGGRPGTKNAVQGSTETVKHPNLAANQRLIMTEIRTNSSGGPSAKQDSNAGSRFSPVTRSALCGDCGAWFGALGMEPAPSLFIQHLVEIFREVRRVLKPSGVCFVNLGNSYYGGRSGESNFTASQAGASLKRSDPAHDTLKPKDLVMIPERFGIAAQDDGWYVRSHIVWAKDSVMPESATDRPTSAWETVWMLTKSARYFCDMEAVKEPMTETSKKRYDYGFGGAKNSALKAGDNPTAVVGNLEHTGTRNLRNVWTINPHPSNWEFCGACERLYVGKERRRDRVCRCGRSDAWTAHFAAYPPALVERMIRMGSSERGCCAECGAPWERVIERKGMDVGEEQDDSRGILRSNGTAACDSLRRSKISGAKQAEWKRQNPDRTIGWRPTCDHPDTTKTTPSIVLDPFMGSGTTAMAAERLGRAWRGCDLSEAYCKIITARVERERQRRGSIIAPRAPTLWEFT